MEKLVFTEEEFVTVPEDYKAPLEVSIYASPFWKELGVEAQYTETSVEALVSSYFNFAKKTMPFSANDELVVRSRDGWEGAIRMTDPRFKPRTHAQIGEVHKELAFIINAEDRQLVMEYCNLNTMDAEEMLGRAINMGLYLSKTLKNPGNSLHIYDIMGKKKVNLEITSPHLPQ